MNMDRCIVKGCAAGLLNNTNNSKQNLLFKVPNEPDILDKWCTALGQILKPGDKVCDIHFKEDDILKNLSTFTKLEGQRTLTFKKRVKLKNGAIPIPVKDSLKIEESDICLTDDAGHLSEDDVKYSDFTVVDESNSDLSQIYNGDDPEESKIDTNDHDFICEFNDDDIILIPPENDSPKVIQQSTKEKVVDNCRKNGVTEKQVIESPEPNDTNHGIQRHRRKRKNNQMFSSKNQLSKSDISPNEGSTTQNKIRKTIYTYSPTKLFTSFDELKYIVQQKSIRQQWCAKVEHNSVFFSHIDFDVPRVNCCLEVAANFKVNAYTADKIIAIYVATTDGVKCVAEIIEIMKVLEKKKWCLGPGIPSVNRSADCIGAMPSKTISDSCAACVKEKLNSLSHTRELANCRIKLEESRHKCELMRKKYNYANTQYERLKAENKILEFQVDEAKKMAINEVLNRLPPLQQSIVRYMIHATYTIKSAVRYSDTWINECIVMRAMNSALYEYMRHKEILPLPCLDTLKKHKLKPAITDDYSKLADLDVPVVNSKLPESLDEIPDPLIIIKTIENCEYPVLAESIEATESSEISESMEVTEISVIPESTNPNDYDIIDLPPDCIISEDFAYEVTVCTEQNEEE